MKGVGGNGRSATKSLCAFFAHLYYLQYVVCGSVGFKRPQLKSKAKNKSECLMVSSNVQYMEKYNDKGTIVIDVFLYWTEFINHTVFMYKENPLRSN